MATHMITVTRSTPVVTVASGTPGAAGVAGNYTLSFQQTYTASGSVNVDPLDAIFVLSQRPVDPTNPSGQQTADFYNVATPFDLQALSVNGPAPGQVKYRVASVTRLFGTQADADAEWAGVKAAVQELLNALTENDRLNVVETVTLTGR